jgi:hypothetical protein
MDDALIVIVFFGFMLISYGINSLSTDVRDASTRIEELLRALGTRESNEMIDTVITRLDDTLRAINAIGEDVSKIRWKSN